MAKKHNIDTLHDRAIKVFEEIKRTPKEEKAQETVSYYNLRRKAHVANELKPILIEMDAAFNRGEVIGECTSLKQWCKNFKFRGALSYARCRQILTGKSGHEGKSVKRLDHLTEGAVVIIPLYIGDDVEKKHDIQFKVDTLPTGDGDFVCHKSGKLKGRRFVKIVLEVIEPEPKKEEPTVEQTVPIRTGVKKTKTVPLTHSEAIYSVHRTWCDKTFSRVKNRIVKVYLDDVPPTCEDCVKAEAEWREKTGFKKEEPVVTKEDAPPDFIRVKLTKAQLREVDAVREELKITGVYQIKTERLNFRSDTYQENAKALVLALEARAESHRTAWKEYIKQNGITGDLTDWNNKEPKALAAKKEHSRLQGAIKACDGAAHIIIFGDESDDPARSILDWDTQRKEAQEKLDLEQYERDWKRDMGDKPSQYLASQKPKLDVILKDNADEKTWAQKVCTPGSPEREQHFTDVIWQREHPAIDPNKGDEFEGEGD